MAEMGDISPVQEAKYAQKLPKFPKVAANQRYGGPKGFLLKMVERELGAAGFDSSQISGGGLKITTTFDKDAQQILADDGLYVPNEAVTYPKDKRPLKELKLIKVDPEEMQKRDDEVKKKFRELFGV